MKFVIPVAFALVLGGCISFQGGYHGRTLLTLAMTGKVLPYKAGFGPLPGDVHHTRFPIPYHGFDEAQAVASLQALFAATDELVALDDRRLRFRLCVVDERLVFLAHSDRG